MFSVMKINGEFKYDIDVDFSIGYEYIRSSNITLIYCFTKNQFSINNFYQDLLELTNVYLLPQTYHDIYYKNYYFNEEEYISNKMSLIKLFQNITFFSSNNFIFFETRLKRQTIKIKLEYNNVDDLKQLLIDEYNIKYLIPFFYTMREMKEYIKEKRIKVKDINLFYLLENKSLEGRKK